MVEKKQKRLQRFNSSYFIGKCYFDDDDGSQNCLIFQPAVSKFLVVQLTEYLDGNLKNCQEKVSQLLLHQAIILLSKLTYIHNSEIEKIRSKLF